MHNQLFTLGLYTIVLLSSYGCCNRIFDRIYESIQSDMFCFKRFNGTHEIGCTSNFWGNVGIVHIVEELANLTWVLEKGPHPPYALAIVPELFTVEVITKAAHSGKISGILLLHSSQFSQPSNFSSDQTCPNKQSSLYEDSNPYSEYCIENPWNPYGSSLLRMNWDFPIFLLTDEESINNIISCYNKFNKPEENEESREWPLCAVELRSLMYGSTNSEVCLRRSNRALSSSLCDPLEDINVWGSLYEFNKTIEIAEKSIIFVSTAADSASLFNNISPGANAAITGIVTLLVTAEALYRHKDDFVDSDKNILFSIFEGESWDYIGSSRMVYDMLNNQFPYKDFEHQDDQMSQLNLSHIHSVIDIKQVGFINKNGVKNLFMHIDPISNSNENIYNQTKDFLEVMLEESKRWDVKFETTLDETPLPPSSFQSFLKKQNISGLVLTDHEFEYMNKYYTSIYDNYNNLNFSSDSNKTDDDDILHKDITQVASILASSLYTILTENKKRIEANESITNELLYCFLKNTNCSYFQENSDEILKTYLKPSPVKTFVSVERDDNPLPFLVLRLLSRYMGKVVEFEKDECKSNNSQVFSMIYFPYIEDGICIETSVHHSSALSPAFIIENYNFKSKEYSTWTESIWQENTARIFLRPSPAKEIGLLVSGIISVLLSIVAVYFFSSRANIIFDSEVTPTPC